ncbi:MAG: protein kinase [Myxococcales bacterium]
MPSVLCHLCGRPAPEGREGDRCRSDDRALVRREEHEAHPEDPFLGRIVAGYPLVELLRPSAVGPTYRALKEPGRREVAIKLLRATGPIEPLAERLRRVMPLVCTLTHPAAVKPLDYGIEPDGVLFVVTELVQGAPVGDLVLGKRPVRPARAVPIVAELLAALAEAHAHGVVHGNLKPGNLMLVGSQDGGESVRLLELGVADVLRPRDVAPGCALANVATPLYVAPEIARGQSASPSTDVYAVGAILYELLSGAPPFDRLDPMATAQAHVDEPIPQFAAKLGISPALDRVVCRALAKLPEDRFASAQAMADALAELSAPKLRSAPALAAPGVAASSAESAAEPAESSESAPSAPSTPSTPSTEPAPEPAPTTRPEPARSAKPDSAPATQPHSPPPPPRAKAPLLLAGALGFFGVLAVALFAIRSTPSDGSGSMLDLVRTLGSGGDEARLTIPPEARDDAAPAVPGQPPRRVVRRDVVKAIDAGTTPEPPDAAAPSQPPPVPPDASAPPSEALLAAVEKPDGSLLINCTNRCKVYVDGGLVGESPKAPIPLKEGEHQLRAVNPETGTEREQTVKIKSAQRTRVTLEL